MRWPGSGAHFGGPSTPVSETVLIRGGGEMGSAVADTLHRAGFRVVVLDRSPPTSLRHGIAFASALLKGSIVVEGVEGVLCESRREVLDAWSRNRVAVCVQAMCAFAGERPDVLVEARMRGLIDPPVRIDEARVVVAIGPGIVAGRDAHFVIESMRGPRLGRVLTHGEAEPHSGVPGEVLGFSEERILRAPREGVFRRVLDLGDFVDPGDVVGWVEGGALRSRLRGMIRGLKLSGVEVGAGHKVGDVDPRRDISLLEVRTDKAGAIGRGALLALAGGARRPERSPLPCN
ncbi:MAG: molybdenum hydroxylase [Gemmatimonadetes bacterium]|nr:molybdenum hydroxylase [Gemmatimonadota bacterium]